MTAESATQKGVLERGKTDWLAVEKQYRAGVLSIREIAKQHGVTDTGIRKKAKVLGWTRDLKEQVLERAAEELGSQPVEASSQPPASGPDPVRTQQAIEDGAATVVAVVRSHRIGIAKGRELTDLLTSQLVDVARNREYFQQLVEEETADDKGRKRYGYLMDAIALPKHAATIRDLSAAMKNLVYLERQAFGLTDAPPEPAKPEGEEAEANVTPGFPELAGKWEKVVAGAARVTH